MSYLKTQRARTLLLCFLLSSLVLVWFPGIDLFISRLFFDEGFYLSSQRWPKALHNAVPIAIVVSMSSVVVIYVFNVVFRRDVCGVNGKKVLYLILVLAIGAGLIVNATLKDNFGRARPRDTQEFGGARQFSPAFTITDGCERNCSFSSGDAAGAFFTLSVVLMLSRRRAVAAAAIGFGAAVSFARVAIGAHYFSDTVVSLFVMLIVSDAIHHYLFVAQRASIRTVPRRRSTPAIQPSSAFRDP